MTLFTLHTIRASAFFIAKDLILRPKGALDRAVFELNGISAVVLRVVSIDTLVSVMLVYVRTKNAFIFIEVEVLIFFEVMKQFYLDFILTMGKGAEIAIFTFKYIVRMRETEFSFIAFWMIKLFDFIVAIIAIITSRALITFSHVLTHVGSVMIDTDGPFSIIFMMVVFADFRVMISFYKTRFCLEILEIEDSLTHHGRILLGFEIVFISFGFEFLQHDFATDFIIVIKGAELGITIKEAARARFCFVEERMKIDFILSMSISTGIPIRAWYIFANRRALDRLIQEIG